MIRLFWAIDLDPPIRSALEDFQHRAQKLLPRVNWVNPDSLHITVKFLGDVDEDRLDELHRIVQGVVGGHPSFCLRVKGVGGFPNLKLPRVIWAGISGQVEALGSLAAGVEEASATLGFPSELHPFRPHLTLARVKTHAREVGEALARSRLTEEPNDFGTLRVERLDLFRSELTPLGARYHRLREISLRNLPQ